MSRRPALAVALPLVALLAGGGTGWWMSRTDDESATTADDTVQVDAAQLAADAPARPLPARTDPAVIDISSVVGYPTPPAAVVPPRAATELRVGPDGVAPVVNAL
ncbi:MAG TPA: hypothetical protein DCR14_08350, partial [Acidimicrobiaceae bacterium]|nr:hypothetical protein [Acidimicrobiaceae bacterium]